MEYGMQETGNRMLSTSSVFSFFYKQVHRAVAMSPPSAGRRPPASGSTLRNSASAVCWWLVLCVVCCDQ